MLPGKYLVAGATGLMGSHVLLHLRNVPNVQIRATYHKRPPHIQGDNITYVHANLSTPEDCQRIVDDVDYVFMLAGKLLTAPVLAKNPVTPVNDNLFMTVRLLEAVHFAGVKKLVWLSSSTAYPLVDEALAESQMMQGNPPDIHFGLGWMTRFIETQCQMYAEKLHSSIDTIVLRPTTIYGEYGDFNFKTCHMLPALIRRVVECQSPIEVWGTGENSRDLIYAGDVVEACFLALEKVQGFEAFNIGYGQEYTVNELLQMILQAGQYSEAKIVHLSSKPSSVRKKTLNLSKARQMLRFIPKTSIEDGIAKVMGWYRQSQGASFKQPNKTF